MAIYSINSTKVLYWISVWIIAMTSCQESSTRLLRIDHQFLNDHKLEEWGELAESFGARDLKMFYLSGDFLPTSWDYSGREAFYEMETLHTEDFEFLIYTMKTQPENVIVDVRVATIRDGQLQYNFSIWTFSDDDEDYTLVKKEGDHYFAAIYLDSKIVAKYYFETGIVELINNE